MRAITFSVLALALMTACGGSDKPLRDLRASGGGPDEFAVIPQLPLVLPPTTALPEPTPGGSNRADPNPNAAAISALGGSASAQIAGGIPAGDAALVAQAGRYGVSPGIRAELAADVFNPLGRDRYFPAYARQALDANAELARLRAAGVAVPTPPSANPQPAAQPTAQPPAEPEQAEPQQGLFGRVFQPGAPRQNCVFTTEGPGNELRRVCTPVEEE